MTDDNENETPTRLYEDQQALIDAASAARDKALAWVADLIDDRESKGIGAALTAFDRLQERIERMEDRQKGSGELSGNWTLSWAGSETCVCCGGQRDIDEGESDGMDNGAAD